MRSISLSNRAHPSSRITSALTALICIPWFMFVSKILTPLANPTITATRTSRISILGMSSPINQLEKVEKMKVVNKWLEIPVLLHKDDLEIDERRGEQWVIDWFTESS